MEYRASLEIKRKVYMADGDVKFVERLIKKHGANVKAMVRDMKLNPYQHSVGQIKVKLQKYQEHLDSNN